MSNQPWVKGQRAVINRRRIVTIDKVTPSGRAVVGGTTYDRDGWPCGKGRCTGGVEKLEHLTPEIEAQVALIERGDKARYSADLATDAAIKWLRQDFSSFRQPVPKIADVERAERLAEAIRGALGDAP